MEIEVTRDAARFGAAAEALIRSDLAYNALGTVFEMTRDGVFESALFAYGREASGTAAFAQLRTPPRPMLTTALAEEHTGPLIERWLAVDPELPGVAGPPAATQALGAAWAALTGGETECALAMAQYRLTEVTDPPRPAAGTLRLARADERALLIEWWAAFVAEFGGAERENVAPAVDARLHHDRVFVWEHDGAPVSMVAVHVPIAGVVRIGPVYTPGEHRGRGYAGTAVAAASRRLLAAGANACMLNTDLANPTANKIYQEIGYRRVNDWEERRFLRT